MVPLAAMVDMAKTSHTDINSESDYKKVMYENISEFVESLTDYNGSIVTDKEGKKVGIRFKDWNIDYPEGSIGIDLIFIFSYDGVYILPGTLYMRGLKLAIYDGRIEEFIKSIKEGQKSSYEIKSDLIDLESDLLEESDESMWSCFTHPQVNTEGCNNIEELFSNGFNDYCRGNDPFEENILELILDKEYDSAYLELLRFFSGTSAEGSNYIGFSDWANYQISYGYNLLNDGSYGKSEEEDLSNLYNHPAIDSLIKELMDIEVPNICIEKMSKIVINAIEELCSEDYLGTGSYEEFSRNNTKAASQEVEYIIIYDNRTDSHYDLIKELFEVADFTYSYKENGEPILPEFKINPHMGESKIFYNFKQACHVIQKIYQYVLFKERIHEFTSVYSKDSPECQAKDFVHVW